MKLFSILIGLYCIAIYSIHAFDIQEGINVTNFYNVIAQDGADPWVYKHTNGYYYMTRTTGDVRLWRSRTFTSLDAGDSILVWSSPGSGAACKSAWAPELHYLDSKWYIYFTATTCDDNIANHRMFVLENTNPDPFQGSFIFKGQIRDSTNKWAIDGTAFQLPSGQLYFIWSGWEGDTAAPQFLYIAQMSNPWTISSDRIEISRPTYAWEKSGGAEINEGPEITIRNGVISLVYSAAACWTDNYCLGLITATTDSNLMYPSSWHKHPNPIFQSANNVFGPGHHSLTTSPDGKEDWIVYHSARYQGSGEVRQVRTQKFTWNADSTPNLGSPIDRNTPIPIPSGELIRIRYEAESARLINNPRIIPNNLSASNRTKVGYIDYANSVVELTIQCNRAGTYVILIRNANGTDGKPNSSHWLTINNGTRIELPIVYSGWDMWGMVMIRANLVQGVNTLTIMKGDNFAEIDEIDIFPYQS